MLGAADERTLDLREVVSVMSARPVVLAGVVAILFLLVCGAAFAAKTYRDPAGDAKLSPDMTSVKVSNTATKVMFRVSFTKAPPLRLSRPKGWVDMLFIGIDVPPLGPKPTSDGEWRGMDFIGGFHGPDKVGVLMRTSEGSDEENVVARFKVVTRGAALTFSIPRRAIGSPKWFTFNIVTAREWSNEDAEPAGAKADYAPNRGSFRYQFSKAAT